MDFLNKFKNGIFVDNQITVTTYEYAVSDYSPEKPEIYREVLDRMISMSNKNSQDQFIVIMILGLYSEIEEDFSKVRGIFFKSLKTKGVSDDFKNGCLIKYARYLLENDRPQKNISKVIDLITDSDLKGLINDLYKFYFASETIDIDSLNFPAPKKTSKIISYALYTEHLIAKVENINGKTETKECLSYFRQQKDEMSDTRHLLSKSTKNYVESKILEACIRFLTIEDCIKILESDLCNPLSEDASLVFKTNAIWLYILAGNTEKANEIEATLPGAEIKSEPANLEESNAEPAPAESLKQVEVASSYFPKASQIHKEEKKAEEESFVLPKPLKKVKFTAIDAARIENTPDENLTPEEQHKYYSYKKKMASIEATRKVDQAEHADEPKVSGWFVKGKQFDKDIDSGIHHLGNNIYAVISDEVSLEEITMKQFKNALTKGFTRREKGKNGVKFVEKSVIELKISSESRLFTEKKYMNSNNEYLIIFDRVGNHTEVKKLAQENSFMIEISADLEDLKSESVSDTHSPYAEDDLSVVKEVEAAGETSEYNVCDSYT